MKCTKCDVGEVALERATRAFSEYLQEVVVDGIEVGVCPACGETLTAYPRWSELSGLVLVALLAKASRLTGGEVRFLRLKAGLKSHALAETLGVAPSQVSRWENDAVPISALADRLVRMVVAAQAKLPAPALAKIDASRSEPLAMHAELTARGWRVRDGDAKAA